MSQNVKIVEVGPRDGLQNENLQLSVADRVEFLQKLIAAGVKWLEGGSLVSPKAIPTMIDSEKVFEPLKYSHGNLSFLVANERGLDRALEAGMNSIAVFTATSDSFTQKNIQRTVNESLSEFDTIVKRAKKNQMRVRGYISTAFGCPFEGFQRPDRVVFICEKLLQMGCDEVSIGDTIGVAHPRQVRDVFTRLKSAVGLERLAAHMHDTRGAALLNIKQALDLGVRTFDSSVGGLGGCPYAPGASGNVATEEVVWFLQGEGFETGIQLDGLLKAGEWIETRLSHPLRSRFYQSKRKQYYFDEEAPS